MKTQLHEVLHSCERGSGSAPQVAEKKLSRLIPQVRIVKNYHRTPPIAVARQIMNRGHKRSRACGALPLPQKRACNCRIVVVRERLRPPVCEATEPALRSQRSPHRLATLTTRATRPLISSRNRRLPPESN